MVLVQMLFLAIGCVAHPGGGNDLFHDARRVPPDVQVYVCVKRASDLRSEIGDTPLGAALGRALGRTHLGKAWFWLARAEEIGERELFEDFVGESITVVLRRGEGGAFDWAALTVVDDDSWGNVSRKLSFRRHAPRFGMTIRTLPDHGLIFARSDELVLVGPHDTGLFRDVLKILADQDVITLADDPGMVRAHRLGKGDIGLFVRHDDPMGGMTAMVASVDEHQMRIRQSSRFANSPFGDAPRPTQIDPAFLDQIAATQVCVVAHPLEWPTGPLAAFLRTQFPEGAIKQRMLDGLGDRMVILVGEVAPESLGWTLALQVTPSDHALDDLDAFGRGIVTVLCRFAEVADPLDENPLGPAEPGVIRSVPIGAAARGLAPHLPGVEQASLCWAMHTGPAGSWWFIGMDARHIEQVLKEFDHLPPVAGPGRVELAGQIGHLRSGEGSHHLRRLVTEIARHLPAEEADSVRAITFFLADLLGAFNDVTWTTEIPGKDRFESQWTFSTAAPDKQVVPGPIKAEKGR